MTPEQIHAEAIEAALFELEHALSVRHISIRQGFLAAIKAYEAAMWRPISEAPKDGTRIIGITDGGYVCVLSWAMNDGYWRRNLHEEFPDRWNPIAFRPLPQPPTQKVK